MIMQLIFCNFKVIFWYLIRIPNHLVVVFDKKSGKAFESLWTSVKLPEFQQKNRITAASQNIAEIEFTLLRL